jgi:hypothetical protein
LEGLRGIEPDAEYAVTKSYGYTPGEPVTLKGAELKGLKIEISERPGSVIVEYARK